LKIARPNESGWAPKSTLPASSIEGVHILLVEDHDDTRMALKRLLKRRGYKVFAAPDMAGALTIAETCEIGLVISDIGLPDGTGYELIKSCGRVNQCRPSL
jgi:DNA-binding response OmpR family regulator